MIYSDTYAVLALAAANTSRIWLGPGVTDAQETAALRDFNVPMSVVGPLRRCRIDHNPHVFRAAFWAEVRQ